MDWPEVARAFSASLPQDALQAEVLAWSAGRSMAAKGPWSLAFSGGADSLALLLLLWCRWPEKRPQLQVLHFNHRLRGAASAADLRFCKSVCRALNLSFVTGQWMRAKSIPVSEAAARDARYSFFAESMATTGSKVLLLGHQAEDIAETMLMRLARGSGVGGLSAPRPLQELPPGFWRLRPLLGLSKKTLEEKLRLAGACWRVDASNHSDVYYRNRIRRNVLPGWLEATTGRDALGGAVLSRSLLQEDDEALEAWLRDLKPWAGGGKVLRLAPLLGKPKALWRRAVHTWLLKTPYRGDLSRQGFAALLEMAMLGKASRQSLGNEGFACVKAMELRYVRRICK